MEGFHFVDEPQVISPLHNSIIRPEDLMSQAGSNSSSSSSSSSMRRTDAHIKAAITSLEARQLKEWIRRENEACKKEFKEELPKGN